MIGFLAMVLNLLGHENDKIGHDGVLKPHIGDHSLHDATNGNGMRLASFAAGKDCPIPSFESLLSP